MIIAVAFPRHIGNSRYTGGAHDVPLASVVLCSVPVHAALCAEFQKLRRFAAAEDRRACRNGNTRPNRHARDPRRLLFPCGTYPHRAPFRRSFAIMLIPKPSGVQPLTMRMPELRCESSFAAS
jgi:hypothetical protein